MKIVHIVVPAACIFGVGGAFHAGSGAGSAWPGSPATSSGVQSGRCGLVRIWTFPEEVAVTGTPGKDRTSEELTTQARITELALVAELHCIEVGRYPSRFADMERMQASLKEARTCGVVPEDTRDAWDQPIYYGLLHDRPLIVSAGADGRFTTADDVSLPSLHDAQGRRVDVGKDCAVRAR